VTSLWPLVGCWPKASMRGRMNQDEDEDEARNLDKQKGEEEKEKKFIEPVKLASTL